MTKRFFMAVAVVALCAGAAVAQTRTIAHRGYWTAPGSAQNSLASLQKADSVGCYGSEFDLWLTKDNQIVVHHDANVSNVIIEQANYADLLKFPLANGEKVPTLEQYLKLGKKLKTQMICEIKPHKDEARTLECVERTLKAFKKAKMKKRVTYISFSLPAVKKLIAEAPKGTEVYYLGGGLTPQQLKEIGAAGPDYHIAEFRAHKSWIKECHDLGLKANVWTVDDEPSLREMNAAGVDFITTNNPEGCQRITGEK